VTTASSKEAVLLAQRLRSAGAKMYGAFWCSHCYDQKLAFGKAAEAELPYVECFPQGYRKVGGQTDRQTCPMWSASCRATAMWVGSLTDRHTLRGVLPPGLPQCGWAVGRTDG
jgi:hypothetical protein